MKIAIFTDTFPPEINGVATSCGQLANVLRAHGHDVYVFTSGEKTVIDLENGIIRVKGMKLKKIYGYRLAFPSNRRIMKVIKSLNLDLIHVNTEYGMGLMAKFAAKKYKIPMVYTFHTMIENYVYYITKGVMDKTARKIVRRFIKYFAKTACEIIAPSQATKDYLMDLQIDKYINVIPTGFDFSKFLDAQNNKEKCLELKKSLQISSKSKVFLCLGRVAKEKSFDVVFRYIDKYIKKHPSLDCKLVMVGDGPFMNDLKKIAKEEKIDNHVIYTGKIPYENVPYYYAMSDLYLNASTTETQGLTYMETMAAGTLLLVQKCDCLEGLVGDGINGFYFDSYEEFEQKLDKILKLSDEEKAKIKENASKTVQMFGSDVFYNNIMVSYNRALREDL